MNRTISHIASTLIAVGLLHLQTAYAQEGPRNTKWSQDTATKAEECNQPRPGSYEAIMSYKDPQHYGPCGKRGPQPRVIESQTPDDDPAPGSYRAIMSVKDPQNYGPQHWGHHGTVRSTNETTPDTCNRPRPGSWEAIMSVKDPQHFGPCGKRNDR